MTGTLAGSVVVGYLDGGQWSACFGLSYRDMLLHDQASTGRIVRPGGKELRQLTGSGGIPTSRNRVTRAFLDETDGEWLFMVDTDMGFAADTAERLVAAADPVGRPVVGALCFALTRDRRTGRPPLYAERSLIQPTVYEWHDGDEVGFVPDIEYPRDQLVQAAGTGAACLLLHRDALAKVRAYVGGDAWWDPITHPTGGPNGTPRTFSEDLSFCLRLAGAGIPLHVDTSVKTTHEKGGLFLDEETFDQQMALEALSQREV